MSVRRIAFSLASKKILVELFSRGSWCSSVLPDFLTDPLPLCSEIFPRELTGKVPTLTPPRRSVLSFKMRQNRLGQTHIVTGLNEVAPDVTGLTASIMPPDANATVGIAALLKVCANQMTRRYKASNSVAIVFQSY